jgi:hypothetical protein
MQTFKSFAAMAAYLRAEDVKRAQNLKRSRPIANVLPGTGPRVAK